MHVCNRLSCFLISASHCHLIENAQGDIFKAPCCCFENAPNTSLTIVYTINVSIDCKKNKVSNLNQEKNILDCKSRQQVAWFVFCFKIKLCAKMMFSLLLQLQIMNENLKFLYHDVQDGYKKWD